MSVTPVFAILTILMVPFRHFVIFCTCSCPGKRLFAKMAISGKAGWLLLPVINEL